MAEKNCGSKCMHGQCLEALKLCSHVGSEILSVQRSGQSMSLQAFGKHSYTHGWVSGVEPPLYVVLAWTSDS